ncbi:hypothetical protein G9A89_022875 [Geosiphon pyriformis]|nr:hypothetical protein G9A89_022875 [Geosiphon pyriformis]
MHQLIPSLAVQQSGSRQQNSETSYAQYYLSLLVTLKNTQSNYQETNQKPLTNNILPATITNDKLLAVIFFFEIKELAITLLFSGAALNTKLITVMYTNVKTNTVFD